MHIEDLHEPGVKTIVSTRRSKSYRKHKKEVIIDDTNIENEPENVEVLSPK